MTRRWVVGALLAAASIVLAACAAATPGAAQAPASQPAVTHISVASTATASPVPPSATPSAEPTNTPVPSAIPPSAIPTSAPSATVPPIVHFMAVGDLMLGRSISQTIETIGPSAVFSNVASTLAQADLLAGNLECVISDQGQPQPKSYTFRAPPDAIQSLAAAGFNVVSLANNHSMDYGLDGLGDMLMRLRVGGVQSVGAGADADAARAPVIITRNGVHIAFLAYVNVPIEGSTNFDTHSWAAGIDQPGVAWADVATITKDVTDAKTIADVVIVLLHSGLEGQVAVSPMQRTLAHAAIDAGASLVIGSHTHTLQPVERYKDGLIAYSLGNFVFDGFTAPSNYSAIFTATITPDGVQSYNWVPVVVDKGLPRLATKDEAALILPLVAEQ